MQRDLAGRAKRLRKPRIISSSRLDWSLRPTLNQSKLVISRGVNYYSVSELSGYTEKPLHHFVVPLPYASHRGGDSCSVLLPCPPQVG